MELLLVRIFLFICVLLSAWDIFTGVVGIAAVMSRISYSSDIAGLFGYLISNKLPYVVVGVAFSLVVVMSDYLFMKVYDNKELEKKENARLAAEKKANKSGGTPIDYIKFSRNSIYCGFFFWAIFKVIDFETTVVGTAQLLGVQLQENANVMDVWMAVSGNSWTQMAIVMAASLMITGAHIGVALFVKIIEFLSKPKPPRKP